MKNVSKVASLWFRHDKVRFCFVSRWGEVNLYKARYDSKSNLFLQSATSIYFHFLSAEFLLHFKASNFSTWKKLIALHPLQMDTNNFFWSIFDIFMKNIFSIIDELFIRKFWNHSRYWPRWRNQFLNSFLWTVIN